MDIQWVRKLAAGIGCSLMAVSVAGAAQKPDEWAMNNAMIGPDSPIEIRAGSSYIAQAMYPVPDGPLFPLKANVAWSIAPGVKGIAIDSKSGKISVDADVPHGASTTVYANINGGRRRLEAKLYVFRPEENPLVGTWDVDRQVACGETQEMKTPALRHTPINGAEWKFHVDRQFWIGKEMNIAAGILLSGGYEYDLKKKTLKLLPQWPPSRPTSSWSYSLQDNNRKLLLRPLEAENGSDPGCSFVLHLR